MANYDVELSDSIALSEGIRFAVAPPTYQLGLVETGLKFDGIIVGLEDEQ